MVKWYRWKMLRKIIKFGPWNIAIRQCDNDFLYFNDNVIRTFISIPNIKTHWFADPILYENQDRTWLFVEAFNVIKKRGEIGVLEIIDGQATNFKIIIENEFHMSFPYVFDINGTMYMIPETGDNNTVMLYRATSFPYEWEMEKVLISGDKYRDSTVYKTDDKIYLYTYLRTDSNRFLHTYKCLLYELKFENMSMELIEEYPDCDVDRRSAGPVFIVDNKAIHTTQICKKCYGEALEFWISALNEKSWKNLKPYKKVYGSNVVIKDSCVPEIIHTYSKTSKYEAIDYKNRK